MDSPEALRYALDEAWSRPGHELIRLHPGRYTFEAPLILDECAVPSRCLEARPAGVTLEPAGGTVVFAGGAAALIEVRTGRNVLRRLDLEPRRAAVLLRAGPHSGFNTLDGLFVTGAAWGPLVWLQSRYDVVQGGWFVRSLGAGGPGPAVLVDGGDAAVTDNLLSGPFEPAVRVRTDPASVRLRRNTVQWPTRWE